VKSLFGLNLRTKETSISVEISNKGRVPCTISSLSVELDWEGPTIPVARGFNGNFFDGPDLPFRLDHLTSISFAIPTEAILSNLPEGVIKLPVRLLVELANGKKIRSNRYIVSRDGLHGPKFNVVLVLLRRLKKFVVREIRRTRPKPHFPDAIGGKK
jgi:hypothetical protein